VVKFKYALTANEIYNSLRRKYLQAMDKLNTGIKEGACELRVNYQQILTGLESLNRDLKTRLKISEDKNSLLSREIEIER
jgi:hypothetical protein